MHTHMHTRTGYVRNRFREGADLSDPEVSAFERYFYHIRRGAPVQLRARAHVCVWCVRVCACACACACVCVRVRLHEHP